MGAHVGCASPCRSGHIRAAATGTQLPPPRLPSALLNMERSFAPGSGLCRPYCIAPPPPNGVERSHFEGVFQGRVEMLVFSGSSFGVDAQPPRKSGARARVMQARKIRSFMRGSKAGASPPNLQPAIKT